MSTYTNIEIETIQAVVDRVSSWQDGATEGTVETELANGFTEAGIEVAAEDRAALASAIQDEHGEIDAASVLSSRG
ncbi:hypothetical protein RDV89_00105 [Nocardioides zeae]|uniref:Uncharacterized protein n=1 Tax=Nocardioides imazamoxiresistens TaxID=3231893 RepID=A0ABU3PQJ1_9ACTN|nr:hypothetical protein [Nocardioides zeae]MDT9591446.1 hypothetical protein [Nocardioides zeae]